MGCTESIPARMRSSRLTEERGSFEVDSPDRIARFTKLLVSRSLAIDFRDSDNRTFYEESDFVTECLRYHNLFRNRHNAPSLKLSPELCHSAQSWANHLAHTGHFYHQNLPDIGENLYCRWNYTHDCDVTGREAAEYWYKDQLRYNFNLEADVLHVNASAFTQMIWIATEDIGFGKARSRDGKFVVVANYNPAGNNPCLFYENVLPVVSRGEEEASTPGTSGGIRRSEFELDDWDSNYSPASVRAKTSHTWNFESAGASDQA